MLFLKYLLTTAQICLGVAPACISILAIRFHCWPLALIALVGVFITVAVFPFFRKRESLWIFFFIFITMTPINIAAVTELLNSFLFEDSFLLTNILRGGLVFVIMLSIEELACGFVARLIWKRQYKMLLLQE